MLPRTIIRHVVVSNKGQGCLPVPLPPGHHLIDADEEASKQVPEAVEEAGDDAAKGQVGSDIHRHDTIESAACKSQCAETSCPMLESKTLERVSYKINTMNFILANPSCNELLMRLDEATRVNMEASRGGRRLTSSG